MREIKPSEYKSFLNKLSVKSKSKKKRTSIVPQICGMHLLDFVLALSIPITLILKLASTMDLRL